MSVQLPLSTMCESILDLSKSIQSVSIISKYGRPIEQKTRDELSKIPDQINETLHMQCVLQISMGRDFDEEYGSINYHVDERKNFTMLTFPMNEYVLLVITKKNHSPISLARKITNTLSYQYKLTSITS